MKYSTKQKEMILSIIRESSCHLTAEEIFEAARLELQKIALGTVYRNLKELCEAGLVRKIELSGEPDRFDKTLTPHEHSICPVCKKAEDIFLPTLASDIERAIGKKSFSYTLTVSALCCDCEKARRDANNSENIK